MCDISIIAKGYFITINIINFNVIFVMHIHTIVILSVILSQSTNYIYHNLEFGKFGEIAN